MPRNIAISVPPFLYGLWLTRVGEFLLAGPANHGAIAMWTEDDLDLAKRQLATLEVSPGDVLLVPIRTVNTTEGVAPTSDALKPNPTGGGG